MEIRNIGSINSNISPVTPKVSGKTEAPEKIGYSPVPEDSFKPENGEKKGVIEKVVDGISNFITENIIGPTGQFAGYVKKDFGAQCMVAGGIVGGATGAFIGYEASGYEETNALQHNLTWQEPTMQNKYLGDIPEDYYSWSRWDHHSYQYDENMRLTGGESVYGKAPIYDGQGKPTMHDVTKTIDSKRFSRFGGTAMGLSLGVVAGVMGGFAVALISKIIKGEK